MYLGGMSLTVRSAFVFVAFSLVLIVSRSLPAASVAMAIAALLEVAAVTLPLAHLESEKSRRPTLSNVLGLFAQSWPLFAALFSYTLIENMPKFVMEGSLSYDNQLYYNVLYFPTMYVVMTAQTVYKPMLVRMANVWRDPDKRKRFDLIILAVVAGVAVLTALTYLVMSWVGLDVLSFLYGLDFGRFGDTCAIMLVAGGMAAGADFLSQVITILRRQHDMVPVYALSLALSLFVPLLLVKMAGLEGAAASYLITMAVLFLLMLWTYVRIAGGCAGTTRRQRTKVRSREVMEWASIAENIFWIFN